jgi:hypothetical protein
MADNFSNQIRRFGVRAVIIVACILGAGWLFLAVPTVRDSPGYARSMTHLISIGLACHHYHDVHGCFPPAVIRSKDGKALYSWRVALLPYLEQSDLYDGFKRDEPWDSPHNRPLLEKMPRCYLPGYESPRPPYATPFQVFVGPGTAFERAGLTIHDCPDGTENTVLVVEASEAVPWTAPQDLSYGPGLPLPRLGGRHSKPIYLSGTHIETRREPGFSALFVNGRTRFLKSTLSEETLRGMITRNGGEQVEFSNVALVTRPQLP